MSAILIIKPLAGSEWVDIELKEFLGSLGNTQLLWQRAKANSLIAVEIIKQDLVKQAFFQAK